MRVSRTVMRLALAGLVLVAALVLAALIGLAVGIAATRVLGEAYGSLVVLCVGAVFVAGAARRFLSLRSRPLLPAIAVQGAHAVWLLVGVIATGRWGGLLLDVGPLAGALVWLGLRADRRARNVLLAVHAMHVTTLLVQFARSSEAGAQFPFLVSHLALRAAGILLTLRALETIWRRDARSTTASHPPAR